jgi:hypothetical protein
VKEITGNREKTQKQNKRKKKAKNRIGKGGKSKKKREKMERQKKRFQRDGKKKEGSSFFEAEKSVDNSSRAKTLNS